MSEYPEAADGTEALPLDPFGAQPQWASRIPGLGGTEPPADPAYVFATADSRPAIGPVRATVRFHDPVMTQGTLLFEVRVRSALPGAEPTRLKTITVDAAELIAAGGVVELTFESYRNAYYAIACDINDETDIVTSAISVALDRQAPPEDHGREWKWSADAKASRRPGIETALIGRVMTDLTVPRLETPQSQVGSPLQCREPAFMAAMQALGRESVGSFENWSLAYVLRAIARFAPGDRLRMQGYGVDQAILLSYYAGRGCDVVGTRLPAEGETADPGEALHRLWRPELCGEADFFGHAHLVTGDIRYPVATLLDQFDVLWSIGANRLMTPGEYVYFVVNGLAHAKPGALAVHVFDYVEDVDAERGQNLNQHDIERMTAISLSHANDVARLQFLHGARTPEKGARLPFGLVLMRGGQQ